MIGLFVSPAGLIMSLTRPCYANDQVLGIVGLDMNMADILEDVTYFEEGDRSYAFLIDNQGKIIKYRSCDVIKIHF